MPRLALSAFGVAVLTTILIMGSLAWQAARQGTLPPLHTTEQAR